MLKQWFEIELMLLFIFIATTPEDIANFFDEIVYHANAIQNMYSRFHNLSIRGIGNIEYNKIHQSQTITVSLSIASYEHVTIKRKL